MYNWGMIFVTGNKNKLEEFKEILGAENISSKNIDLDEIQSVDVGDVALDKAKRAYDILKQPVVVEDVSFELDEFGGLPGPFIKYFEQKFPKSSMIKMLGDNKNRGARAIACIAYFDGKNNFVVKGIVNGGVTKEIFGEGGFGFDHYFVPDGYTKTFAQMGKEEKNKISHRKRALDLLKEELLKRGLI